MHKIIPLFVVLLLGCGTSTEPEEVDHDPLPPIYWDPGTRPPGSCGYGYGECEPTVDCSANPCANGVCVNGDPDRCVCHDGYTDTLCDSCAIGYQSDGTACVPLGPCANEPCVFGTCRMSADQVLCDCFTGYDGVVCDQCAVDYHSDGSECVPN